MPASDRRQDERRVVQDDRSSSIALAPASAVRAAALATNAGATTSPRRPPARGQGRRARARSEAGGQPSRPSHSCARHVTQAGHDTTPTATRGLEESASEASVPDVSGWPARATDQRLAAVRAAVLNAALHVALFARTLTWDWSQPGAPASCANSPTEQPTKSPPTSACSARSRRCSACHRRRRPPLRRAPSLSAAGTALDRGSGSSPSWPLLQPVAERRARPAFARIARRRAHRLAAVNDGCAGRVGLVGLPRHGAFLAHTRLGEVAHARRERFL